MSALQHNVADIVWKIPGLDLRIVSFQADFTLNQLYCVEVEVKAESPSLNPKDFLNKEAEFVLKCGSDLSQNRKFGGIITRFSQGRTRHGNLKSAKKRVYLYHIRIQPKLFLLTRNSRSKVYQEMTVRDIVAKLLDDHGVDSEWHIQGALPEREYVVQYEESDYSFISRLLEDEGIAFFFDLEEGKVVFSNNPGGFPDCRPLAKARYIEEISPKFKFGKHEYVQDLDYEEQISTGKAVVNHYNYETALLDLISEKQKGEAPQFAELEHYEHSQNFPDLGKGSRYAQLRNEEYHCQALAARGTTSCRSFEAGYVVALEDHFRGDLNIRWLLTQVSITAEQGDVRCTFGAVPAKLPYRPARRTPRPKVYGLQTAVVTGPDMGEPYLDPQGRCKLQFHWDREGGKNESSSMWVRLSNNYAGKDYGIQWIPRVGHEVLVTFIDGNPDLPIVTGRVYNSHNNNPLGPDQKYRNIIKTIKDNHLMFDDKDGEELVDLRADRDMHTLVEHNDQQRVGNDRSIQVGNDHDERIGRNRSLRVGTDQQIEVGHDGSQTVNNDLTERVGANMSLSVGQVLSVAVGGNLAARIGANSALTVSGASTTSVTGKAELTSGDTVKLTASNECRVEVGAATIILKKSGDIEISGSKITIKGSGQVVVKGAKIGLN